MCVSWCVGVCVCCASVVCNTLYRADKDARKQAELARLTKAMNKYDKGDAAAQVLHLSSTHTAATRQTYAHFFVCGDKLSKLLLYLGLGGHELSDEELLALHWLQTPALRLL